MDKVDFFPSETQTRSAQLLKKDINKIKILESEEQFRHIMALQKARLDGDTSKALEEQNILIESNLRLIRFIAQPFSKKSKIPMQDLIGIGTEAMIHALRNFDITIGTNFIAYLHVYITGSIKNYVNDARGQGIHIPRNIHQQHQNIEKDIAKFHARFGRNPNNDELSILTGYTVEKITALKNIPQVHEFNDPVDDSAFDSPAEGLQFLNMSSDTDKSPEALTSKKEIQAILKNLMSILTENEHHVITLRYLTTPSQSLEQIASLLKVTHETVRQWEMKALRKIRIHRDAKKLSNALYE